MKTYSIGLVIVMFVALGLAATGEEKEVPKELTALQKQYEAAVARAMKPINANYGKALENLQRKLAYRNRLDDAMAVRAVLAEHVEATTAAPPQASHSRPIGKLKNIAGEATATALEYHRSAPPASAIDGDNKADGWATGQRRSLNTWLKLTWAKERIITEVTLYDRPNDKDWMQEATIEFSNDTTVEVKDIADNGTGRSIKLRRPVKARWLKITPTKQGPNTVYVGLSEVEVMGK